MLLFCHIGSTGLTNNIDLDLAGVFHLGLDLLGNLVGHKRHTAVGYHFRFYHHADLTAGLYGVSALHALKAARDLLQLLQALNVVLHILTAGAGTGGRYGVCRLNQAGDHGLALYITVMRLNGVHNGFALFILAGKFHAQGNMAAFHLVIQSLADVVQQTCAAGQSLISTQFRGHQPGNITHFQAVLEHALSVGSTVFQFTKQAHQLRVNGTAVGFQYSLLALLLNGGVYLTLGLFVQLLNAGGVNAAVLDQSLQGQAGNLSAHRVKGADGDGFRRVVDDQVDAGQGLQGADVAAHAAVIGELLDHDLPVFTELNLVSDGYRENMAKAAAKKLPLFLSSTMLYRRETQYIKQQVAEFGKPVHYIYHIGQYLPDWHPWENYKNFFVGNARTGGVREIFGIDLPWLLDAFGDVESVTVQKDTISDLGLPYPDCVTLLLRHKGGVQGVLAADVVSRKAVRSFECFGDGIHLFWEGNPKALYEFKDGDKRFVNTYASFEHDSRYSDNVVENAYVDELTNFFGVLKGDEQPKWSFEKDLKAIELMDFIESH